MVDPGPTFEASNIQEGPGRRPQIGFHAPLTYQHPADCPARNNNADDQSDDRHQFDSEMQNTAQKFHGREQISADVGHEKQGADDLQLEQNPKSPGLACGGRTGN